MRVLVTTTPGRGHLFPMVPLAWALRCAGHQVLVAGPRPIARAVRAAGLEHVPVGGNASPGDPRPGPGGLPSDVGYTVEPWVALAEHTVAETIDVTGQLRPHLVISGYVEYAGPIAAALSGVPLVSHHCGLHLSDELAHAMFSGAPARRLYALQERFGLLPEETAAAETIDLCPASLHRFDATGWLPMRYIPFGGAGVQSPHLWARRTRPRVCVSLGNVPIEVGLDGLRDVVRGLAGFDGEVVLTGAGSRSPALARLPDNVSAAGWLPHDQVFPTCDVVIHHGGSATAMNALLFALPQLVLPRMGDQLENAARLVAGGVARSIGPSERASVPVRPEVERLLTAPAYRAHAHRIRSEIESMPAPGRLVRPLEELAEAGRAVANPCSRARVATPVTP